ncbi:MAG: primase [Patescibacteria group bacterium]|nr:primase [Patescibacteria group bacterium]
MFSPVDQIKERLNIVDVVSMYVPLTSAGKNYKGKSPFKQERTPSFYVSPDKGLYHCFSTGKGGDMFTFVQEMEGLDFKGALKVLADKAGISLQNWSPKEKEEKDNLYEIMESATKIFEELLTKHSEVLEYIKNRGIEDSTIKDFRIGYAPDGWRNLYDKLKDKYSDKDLSLAGLVKKTEKGVYDTFRDRIMFPICDSSGRVIAFSGRIFKDDGKSGKYVNSPDTPLFNKSDVLFAIDKAKNYIRKYNFTTIVEGQFDVIALHQAGFKNTVAVSGTALADGLIGKDKQINNLGVVKRLSNNLVLAFDSDTAGVNAAKRSAHIGMSLGMDVKVLDITEGKDPADFLKDFGKDAWSKILKEAEHVILFYVKKIKQSAKDEREVGRRIKEEVLPLILELPSDIEKSFFIKKISEITNISESYIVSDLKKIKSEVKAPPSTETPKEEVKKQTINDDVVEREIWGIYINKDKSIDVKNKILEIVGEHSFSSMEQKYKDRESEFIFGEKDYLLGEEETFKNFRYKNILKKITERENERKKAESLGDESRADELTIELDNLGKERDKINNSRHTLNK